MNKIITKTRTFFLSLAVFIGTSLSAQTIIRVSSDLDSGPGTLRQSIIDAASGDSIVIPADYTIALASEIIISKNLKINGQGSLVKVTEPGVSNWRVFTLGTTASTATTVSMYNMNLEGGNLSALTGNASYGATVYVNLNHSFTMKNCTVSKGKATYCGGVFFKDKTGASITLEGCTFSDCESTTANGGAVFAKGLITVNNCTFSNNKADLNGGAIACYDAYSPSLISNCRFIGNISHAPSGGAVINYSTTNSVDLENCTFESNTNTIYKTYTTGAGAFAIANATGKSTLTNCTFYNNTGTTSGAIFNAKGTLNLVNCTFAGNSTPSTNGGAYHDINHADAKTTMVNNIFAYNYNSDGLMDVYVPAASVLTGQNNTIGAISGPGTPAFSNPITFNYEPASDLFAAYTTSGLLMPILANNGGLTKTVALTSTSIANGAGVATYGVAIQTMLQFNETSPFLLNKERSLLLNKFETYSDNFPPTSFNQYLTSPEQTAIDLEQTVPILYCYRYGFDKIINEIKNTQVKNGTTAVWLLYNMGFVVKTPSGTFGIDIDHRGAEQFEPYLDFLCVTHNHGDHANTKLMDAMNKKGKPVLSNFYTKDAKYVSKTAASYNIGNFTIQTDISDHLADPKLPNFVTVFRIKCGEDAGNFSMLHCSDSGFNPLHFTKVQGPVNMVVLRYGASRENDILGTGNGQVKPDYAVLSHLIELRHQPWPKGQASITITLANLPSVKCSNTILPFWGEKMTWENGQMH